MTIHVLGLGESLKDYEPDGCTTIGVNDIYSRITTDFVVCVDHPSAFSPDRRKTIYSTKCKGFYSQVSAWSELPNFNRIEFNPGRGFVDQLDGPKYCYSNNSTYVAVVLAYKLGAKYIVMHGVDFRTHSVFISHSRDKAVSDFKTLAKALLDRGVTLYVSSEWSELSRVLPLWPDTRI